ncbi:MAG: DbpA RNA binding domain-containing protein, partial [Bacteroidota bacterium]
SQSGGIARSSIGKLDMSRKHTFFDVEEEVAPKLIKAFRNSTIDGRAIRLNDGNTDIGVKGKKGKKHKKKKAKKKKY